MGQEQQKDNKFSFGNIQRNSVFIEIGGLAGIVSVNYERFVLAGNETGLGFRIVAGSVDTASTAITLTTLAEANFLYEKNKHFFRNRNWFCQCIRER